MQNFMKTIISAVQTWTKGEIKDSTADWNENDSSKDSYVKNRTHWMENHITHMHLDECVFDGFIESGNGWYHTEYLNQPLGTTFEYNKTYTILWDGVEYQTTLREYEGGYCFGHEYYMNSWDDTDLPFGINFKWDASTLTHVCSKTKENYHTLAIYEGHLIVKKLDRMYIDIPPNLATIYDVDDVKQETIDVVNAKMDADNPIGTGSFSMNRKSGTTVGDYSHAEGRDTEASGNYSHAEGRDTEASGNYSHAEGYGTIAQQANMNVYGKFNLNEYSYDVNIDRETVRNAYDYGYKIEDFIFNSTLGRFELIGVADEKTVGRYVEVGKYYVDSYDTTDDGVNYAQIIKKSISIKSGTSAVTVTHEVIKTGSEYTGKYVHIVGNGISDTARSNAHTLDWNGVGWYQGGLQVGGNAQDDGAKNVLLEGDAIPVPADATVGQTIVVKSVDDNGKPTEWEAVDMGGVELDVTLSMEGKAADAKAVGDAISQISSQNADYVKKTELSLGFGSDGKLYIMVSGAAIGDGVEVDGTVIPTEDVAVFVADFSGDSPSAAQFYSWEGRVYDNSVYDALANIQCVDGVAKLTSVYDSENSRWVKQMMTTGGLFESDNFVCKFRAKFCGLAGSWNNVITYGSGTHWTNGVYSDGVKWPAGGEIDAFEQAGGYAEVPNIMHTPAVHYGSGPNSGYPKTHEYRRTGTVEFTTDEWHDFKFSLSNGYVKVWIDGVLVGENDFSDCSVSNNYLCDYKPFTKPQAFYIDGSCASDSGADTSNVYEFEVSDFEIIQDANVECTGLKIYPQMWSEETELVFPVGAELYLDREYTPANTSNKACRWESSNPAVATVVQGFVKVLSTGTTTITAMCGKATAQYILTAAEVASVPCVKITTDGDDGIAVSDGGSTVVTAYCYPSFTTDKVTWGTSDANVATVDNGVVSGVAAGNAYITVSCGTASTVVPVSVAESSKPYISYDFTPLHANINALKSAENESVTIVNVGTFGSAADLTMTAATQTYYADGAYEAGGVITTYNATSPAMGIPLKGNPFTFVYRGLNYADRVYTRKDYASKILLNGTNANIMPSLTGIANQPGQFIVRYGAASSHDFTANGEDTNIVVYSDGTKSYLYINGEKIVDGGTIGYITDTLNDIRFTDIDDSFDGLDVYIGQTFTEDELIAMSTPA